MLTLASSSALASAPEAAADGGATAALVAGLAQTPPTRTAFAEARFSPLLDQPLVSKGELAWLGGEHLRREVSSPFVETSEITGNEVAMTRPPHGTRHFSLDRAPALKGLLDSLVAVLSGDAAALKARFEARVDGAADSAWTLTLRPRDEAARRRLSLIRLDGHAESLRCMEISEARGAVTVDLLGPLAAEMPTAPTRAKLTALCRDAD